ncbi:MAG: hypothetical protein ABIK09_05410 [Pseudomonadota bacterium]
MALLIGAAGGVLFLFLFPGGALSTLMHEVLHLPGPGAGIALAVGPMALLFILGAACVVERFGGATLAAVGFSGMCVIVSAVLALTGNEKGMFGSPWFIAALATCGLVADSLLRATRRAAAPLRFFLAAGGANLELLLFYWLLIFPRTKGWVLLQDVPVLLALCLAGGLVAGVLGWLLSERIPGILPRSLMR